MGYYIRRLERRKLPTAWKLQFVSHCKEHTKGSRALKPKREWDIPKGRWRGLGLYPEMSFVDARAHVQQINIGLRRKKYSERACIAEINRREFAITTTYAFPDVFLNEFEKRYILPDGISKIGKKNQRSNWTAARRVIIAVEVDPSKWLDLVDAFSDFFVDKAWSLSYIKKIIRLANLWGHFYCRKICRSFMPIPYPRGHSRAQILGAYFRRLGNRIRKSAPLTPEALESRRSDLMECHYRWLYLSVWTGLRPREVDQLKNPQLFHIIRSPDGTHVLWVYQSKLVSLPDWERWKPIPLVFDEQKQVREIIMSRNFMRPSRAIVKSRFGINVTSYGGRKGFTDLMLGRNQPLEFIAQWMGHSSIERTWRDYKDRRIYHFRPVLNCNLRE